MKAVDAAKMVMFDAVTGERLERWSVDAKELLKIGAATTDPPTITDAVTVAADLAQGVGSAAEPVVDDAPAKPTGKTRR